MQIIVSSRHFKLYKEIKGEIIDVLSTAGEDTWKLNRVEAVLNRAHKKFHVEVLISGKNLHIEAKAEEEDLLGAFYKAFDKSVRQLNKIMDRRKSHRALHIADLEIIAEEVINRNSRIPA